MPIFKEKKSFLRQEKENTNKIAWVHNGITPYFHKEIKHLMWLPFAYAKEKHLMFKILKLYYYLT
jgi:hypothetical protein